MIPLALRAAALFAAITLAACGAARTLEMQSPAVSPPIYGPLPLPDTAFETGEASDEVAPPPVGIAKSTTTTTIRDEAADRPRFRGAPIDLDLKGADVHDVCRLLAEVGQVNIVVAGDVQGTVTVRLKKVPWDQALDVILRARGLHKEREGNVILVTAK